MPFYAAVGPRAGVYLNPDAWRFVATFDAPVDGSEPGRSIGQARHVGFDRVGAAAWELTVDGAEIPGLWVVVDRRFVPARG